MCIRILVMGVSGCGKSTIGQRLSHLYDVPLIEGDDHHPESNIRKMSSGIPLTDEDRIPWLESLAREMARHHTTGYIVASSALKREYRKVLEAGGRNQFEIVFLHGDKATIEKRMKLRSSHFMPSSLLDSQYEVLEAPQDAINVNISLSLEDQFKKITTLMVEKKTYKNQSKRMNTRKADIGIVGMGVMGKALARNFAGKSMSVALYNAPLPGEEMVTKNFSHKYPELEFIANETLGSLVASLTSPRVILMMVKAGDPVDSMIDKLLPMLGKGDILIDAGNSFYKDTLRRGEKCKPSGIHYVGMGVSGGEEGALRGPSMMPAGDPEVQKILLPMLSQVAARADGRPCVGWIGTGGAGHFVKMIHNGIEYADMQILSEVYGCYRQGYGLSNDEVAGILDKWKNSSHNSYLLDITVEILRKKAEGSAVIDTILDVAGHKGTGLWTSQESLALGVAAPTIFAAMTQRILSSEKALREKIGIATTENHKRPNYAIIEQGILFCRFIALTEGFHIISKASQKYGWEISFPEITAVWRGGCIIRSDMLLTIKEALDMDDSIFHLFESKHFLDTLKSLYPAACEMASELSLLPVAIPAISAAINYYKSMTTVYLPVNMIQAQRDYFGAHTYKRLEDRDTPVHTQWQ